MDNTVNYYLSKGFDIKYAEYFALDTLNKIAFALDCTLDITPRKHR